MDVVYAVLAKALDEALSQLAVMRAAEGNRLAEDIQGKLKDIKQAVTKISDIAAQVVEDYRQKLKQRIAEFSADLEIDPSRLAMEVAIYAERSAIDEEITRLNSHLQQMAETCQAQETVGRKLDFMLQEMNREINTIGSKANGLAIHDVVIEVKSLLEKIREQIQNIE